MNIKKKNVATIDKVEGNTEVERRTDGLDETIRGFVKGSFEFDNEKYKDICEYYLCCVSNDPYGEKPDWDEVYQRFTKILANEALEYVKWYMSEED